jgi:hypothetical protein
MLVENGVIKSSSHIINPQKGDHVHHIIQITKLRSNCINLSQKELFTHTKKECNIK